MLTSGGLRAITDTLTELRRLKLEAETTEKKLEYDREIQYMEAQRDVLLKDISNKTTQWIRPAFAALVIVFWAKLIVWDTVLGLGTTADPGEFVMWFVTLVPSAYFIGRPFEKIFG